jgi:hypothetical protein
LYFSKRRKTVKETQTTTKRSAGSDWVEMVNITPKLAARWLKEYSYSGQRAVSGRHVEYLGQEMTAGRFRPSAFRLMHNCSRSYLTDGQHRLHAILLSGVSVRGIVYHRQTRRETEVAEDYGCADINKVRTIADALAATGLRESSELSRANFSHAASAVLPIIGGFTTASFTGSMPSSKSRGIRKAAVAWWLPTAETMFATIEGGERNITKGITRQAVLSIAFVTLHHQREWATEFWHGVAHDDGLRKGDPRRALALHLMTTPARSIAKTRQSRYAAFAWNCWVQNKALHSWRVSDPAQPIFLEGTPYDGSGIVTFDCEADSSLVGDKAAVSL